MDLSGLFGGMPYAECWNTFLTNLSDRDWWI